LYKSRTSETPCNKIYINQEVTFKLSILKMHLLKYSYFWQKFENKKSGNNKKKSQHQLAKKVLVY